MIQSFQEKEKNFSTKDSDFHISPQLESGFSFSPKLDAKFIDNFYQGDLKEASLMFDVFLTYTVATFYEMEQFVKDKDWKNVQRLAHKMSPTFKIVGLTSVAVELGVIEKMIVDEEEMERRTLKITQNFNFYLSEVINQKMAIDSFISGWSN